MRMYEYELSAMGKGYQRIAGCDEVGRGPLAGPLVAAAVVLDPKSRIEGLDDSKKLSVKKREALALRIKEEAAAYAVVHITPSEVDRLNVYKASQTAMRRALLKLEGVDYVLSDAMPIPELGAPVESIIKGDSKSASIAAASILAKVSRDNYMMNLAEDYPLYGFDEHKGYPTKNHLEALKAYGVMPEHRKSYAPVRKLIMKQQTLELGE